MARLLPLVLLVPATFAAQSSLDTIRPPIKKPTAEHQSQMKSLLTEAATHVRNGGPEEEKLRIRARTPMIRAPPIRTCAV